MVKHTPVKNNVPNYEQLKENFETVHKLMQEKKIVAASTIKFGGLGATIAKMAFGSKVGVAIRRRCIWIQFGFNDRGSYRKYSR